MLKLYLYEKPLVFTIHFSGLNCTNYQLKYDAYLEIEEKKGLISLGFQILNLVKIIPER